MIFGLGTPSIFIVVTAIILVGVAAITAAVLFFLVRHGSMGRRTAMLLNSTDTLTCTELANIVNAHDSKVAPRANVAGRAFPHPGGHLIAPISGRACVWYMVQSTPLERGEYRFYKDHSRMSGRQSSEPFVLADATGSTVIRPAEATVFGINKTANNAEENPRWRVPFSTKGWQHEEWLITEGDHIYVHGKVGFDATGNYLGHGTPEDKLVISSIPLQQVARSQDRAAKAAIVIGIAFTTAIVAVLTVFLAIFWITR